MLVELLLGTGIRIGSALALTSETLDFAQHGEVTLRTTKNDRPTTAGVAGCAREGGEGVRRGRTEAVIPGRRRTGLDVRACTATTHELGLQAAGDRGTKSRRTHCDTRSPPRCSRGLATCGWWPQFTPSIVSTTIHTTVERAKLRAAVDG